ncbi:MAG: LLM class F420-dependent oxidoreductase [bacterium]|nr:LLM class F420-dependent oxidoreductase [bacterium]
MDIGRVGIWTFQLDLLPSAQARDVAAQLDAQGWGAIWFPEAMGREAFTNAAILLGGTRRIPIATGIANVWGRDAMATAAAQRTLAEAWPDRFLLGIGVSHAPLVQMLRGHDYRKPYSFMEQYLEAMARAPFAAAGPATPPETVIGALHPRMLKLAAERTRGAHPYLVTPEHTARARGIMGQGPLLAPEQGVVLETDPSVAREIARTHLATYLPLPNYNRNWRSLGYDDADLENGGSDRLVDGLIAWGDVDTVVARVRAHHDAGADHVCLQVLGRNQTAVPMEEWTRLAEALLA